MDPNQTWQDLLEAVDGGNHEMARELALILERWLAQGGFPPQGCTDEEVNRTIEQVIRGRLPS